MPVVLEDAANGRRVHTQWKDGEPFMVHFYSVDGLLPADYQVFFGPGYLENVKSVAPSSVQYTHLGEDNGCAVIWQRIVPGIPFVSARSLININYPF